MNDIISKSHLPLRANLYPQVLEEKDMRKNNQNKR